MSVPESFRTYVWQDLFDKEPVGYIRHLFDKNHVLQFLYYEGLKITKSWFT